MDLLGKKWCDIYHPYDVNIIVDKISNILIETLDFFAPMKMKYRRNIGTKPDLSKECLSLLKHKNFLRKKAKQSGNLCDWIEWKKVKNKTNNMMRDEKRKKEYENMIKEVVGRK